GKLAVVHYRALGWNLVVIVGYPWENLAHELHSVWWVGIQTAPQFRLFRKRHLLQRPAFRALRKGYRTIHVDAAQHDHASRDTTEHVHQLLRLRTRTDHKINHHIRSEALQFLSA